MVLYLFMCDCFSSKGPANVLGQVAQSKDCNERLAHAIGEEILQLAIVVQQVEQYAKQISQLASNNIGLEDELALLRMVEVSRGKG